MLIEVKISYDPKTETLEQALASLNAKTSGGSAPAKTVDLNAYAKPQGSIPEETPRAQEETKPEPKAAPEPKQESKPEPETAAPVPDQGNKPEPVTKTDIRAIATAISKAGKKAELKAALESFGATKLSDVKEDDYPALKAKLEAINA